MFRAKISFRGPVDTFPTAPFGFLPSRFCPILDRHRCAIAQRDRPQREEWPGDGRGQELQCATVRMPSASASRRVAAGSARYRLNRSLSRESEELRSEQGPPQRLRRATSPLHVARVSAQACAISESPPLSRGPAVPRAFRRPGGASFRGRALRAASFSSARAGPDRHCFHEQQLAPCFTSQSSPRECSVRSSRILRDSSKCVELQRATPARASTAVQPVGLTCRANVRRTSEPRPEMRDGKSTR